VRLGPFLAVTLIGGVFAVGVSTSAAFAGYGPPGSPPGSPPPGFGRIIEAQTVPLAGLALTISVPPCVDSIVVNAKTFTKPVELVVRAFGDQGVNWKKQGLHILCGVDVTVLGGNGLLTREPFSKSLTVSFDGSNIRKKAKVIDLATLGHLTYLNANISGHTATVHVKTDANLAVVAKS
jgi:hypothetical protein